MDLTQFSWVFAGLWFWRGGGGGGGEGHKHAFKSGLYLVGGEMVLKEYKLIRRRAGDKFGHVDSVICQTSTNRKDERVIIY